jgi:hypothetical protein
MPLILTFRTNQRQESELALWLENASPDDPAILETLVQSTTGIFSLLISSKPADNWLIARLLSDYL